MESKALRNLIHPILKIYWFIFRPKTSGVKCIVQNNGKILMIRNTYGHKLWTFPGGGINRGETPEQAVKREVIEEVGVETQDLRKIGDFTTTTEYKKDTVTVFMGKSGSSVFKIDEREILEAKWFSSDNLPEISKNAKQIMLMRNNI
ncbi:MAG: NUDIX domain-containing protein [bacterium]|nr:NUDIX domain-containing protein [bacterium]